MERLSWASAEVDIDGRRPRASTTSSRAGRTTSPPTVPVAARTVAHMPDIEPIAVAHSRAILPGNRYATAR